MTIPQKIALRVYQALEYINQDLANAYYDYIAEHYGELVEEPNEGENEQ